MRKCWCLVAIFAALLIGCAAYPPTREKEAPQMDKNLLEEIRLEALAAKRYAAAAYAKGQPAAVVQYPYEVFTCPTPLIKPAAVIIQPQPQVQVQAEVQEEPKPVAVQPLPVVREKEPPPPPTKDWVFKWEPVGGGKVNLMFNPVHLQSPDNLQVYMVGDQQGWFSKGYPLQLSGGAYQIILDVNDLGPGPHRVNYVGMNKGRVVWAEYGLPSDEVWTIRGDYNTFSNSWKTVIGFRVDSQGNITPWPETERGGAQ